MENSENNFTPKNGFYTKKHTTNTIAIIDGIGYSVSVINEKE